MFLRTKNLRLSVIKQMELRASRFPDVISLAQGVPSFDTPECIKRRVELALKNGVVAKYSLSPGLSELRELIETKLAEDGMFSVVLLVNKTTGQLEKDPIILSRGFVFVKENTDLINYLKQEIAKKFRETTSSPANFDFIREEIQAHIEEIIKEKTGRQPMVLPLVIEV